MSQQGTAQRRLLYGGVITEESLCLQGQEEILMWGTCIYRFPGKMPEIRLHWLFHSVSCMMQDGETNFSWWNSEVTLCAHVKIDTREGIWISEGGLAPKHNLQEGPSRADKVPYPLCSSRQISSFASIWSATCDDFLQLFLINEPHTRSLS